MTTPPENVNGCNSKESSASAERAVTVPQLSSGHFTSLPDSDEPAQTIVPQMDQGEGFHCIGLLWCQHVILFTMSGKDDVEM